MAWVSPTGHNDPDGKWSNEEDAYDGDTGSYAYEESINDPYLELLHAAISCDKVRFMPLFTRIVVVDVYYGEDWHNIFEGEATAGVWKECPIGSTETVDKARFRGTQGGTYLGLKEFEFNEVEGGEVKLLSATSSVVSSVVGSLILVASLTATSATAISTTGSLGVVKSLSGTSATVFTTTGNLSLVKYLSATSSVVSTTTGSLTVVKLLSATAEVASSTSGSLTLVRTLSATSQVGSTAQGSLYVVFSLTGTASTTFLVEGTLSVGEIKLLSATADIVFVIQGSLTSIRLIQRLLPPEGIWQKQELPSVLFCGEETICCGNEHYACGGGYISPKVSKPTGVWQRLEKP